MEAFIAYMFFQTIFIMLFGQMLLAAGLLNWIPDLSQSKWWKDNMRSKARKERERKSREDRERTNRQTEIESAYRWYQDNQSRHNNHRRR